MTTPPLTLAFTAPPVTRMKTVMWQLSLMLSNRFNFSVNSLPVGHEQLIADQGQVNKEAEFLQLPKHSVVRHLPLIAWATGTIIAPVMETIYVDAFNLDLP